MIITGKNLIVMSGGVAIAAAKSCEINIDTDLTETRSVATGSWKTFTPLIKSWQITTSHLLIAANSSSTPLRDAVANVGQSFTLRCQINGLIDDYVTGSAICKTWKGDAAVGGLAHGSFNFVGNGPLF